MERSCWQCYQQLRSIYHATTTEGRRIAEKVIAGFPSCPIPEVARLGRTLKAWRQQLLAYFDTSGVSNGGTEAINLIIEKVRRHTDSEISPTTGSEYSWQPQATALTANDPAHAELRRSIKAVWSIMSKPASMSASSTQ